MMLRFVHLVIKARIFFLQVPGVGQDDSAQINGWLRRINRAAKPGFHQARNPSAMIEVRVRQDHRINCLCRDRRVAPVTLPPFFRPLKQSAVDEYLQPALAGRVTCVDQMLGTGHRTRSTKKLDVSQTCPPVRNEQIIMAACRQLSASTFSFRPSAFSCRPSVFRRLRHPPALSFLAKRETCCSAGVEQFLDASISRMTNKDTYSAGGPTLNELFVVSLSGTLPSLTTTSTGALGVSTRIVAFALARTSILFMTSP